MDVSDANFAIMPDGYLTFVWHEGGYQNDVDLFTFSFVAQKNGVLSESVSIKSNITPSLAYDTESNEYEVIHQYNSLGISKKQAELHQNEPNPFNDESIIDFYIPKAGPVSFTFYDVSGRVVHEIKGTYEAGDRSILIKKESLSGPGIIYYHMEYEDQRLRRKMVIID